MTSATGRGRAGSTRVQRVREDEGVHAGTRIEGLPRVVIVGGGFAGLYAARALARVPVSVTVIDRRNHHLFQPLLYQVATASLSPAQIAAPIRKILSRQCNAEVLMADAVGVDAERRVVRLADGEIPYEYLILATGVTHSYFGNERWAGLAPGLKTIEDATAIRRNFLLQFEHAERMADPEARRAELTTVVVGGGPTGVEMAGALAEIARRSMPRDFRAIDTTTARVVLVEANDRVLGVYPPELSARAKRDLEELGVEVRLGERVTRIDRDGVMVGEERIWTRNVIWAAGVTASPIAHSLGAPADRAGRVRVGPDLSVPGRPEIFVVGDLASYDDPETGEALPGIAPAAIQSGRHAAAVIAHDVRGAAGPRPAFRYHHKGMIATIGRARAVGVVGRKHVTGLRAWLLWVFVHITYLIGFRNRLLVMIDWAYAYLMFQRGARLITGEEGVRIEQAVEAAGSGQERIGEGASASGSRPESTAGV